MADYLGACYQHAREPEPEPELLKSFAMYLELLLDVGECGGLGPPVRTFTVDEEPLAFGRMEFSPDARRLLYEGPSGMVCLDANSGRRAVPAPEDQSHYATDRWRSSDGRLTTDRQDFVGILDASGRVLRRLIWERDSSEACTVNRAFNPDGRLIAVSYAYDSSVRLFEVDTGTLIAELHAPDHEAQLAFSPDQRLLLAGTKSGVRLFLLASGLSVLPPPRRRTNTVAYHPEGTAVVVSDDGPALHRIDVRSLSNAYASDFDTVCQRVLDNEALLLTHPGTIWQTLISLIWLLK